MVEFGRHLGELPWGWWLRAGSAGFEDPEGRTWRSVRDAFWEGELKLSSADEALDQHELMLRVMTSIREGMSARESMHDIFEGDMMFSRFYRCWLANIGMIEPSHGRATLEAPLSALGRSVLMMLQATREPEFEGLPMRAVVAAVTAAKGADAEARERALLTFEREVGFRRHVFARERVGTRHLVTLTGITAGARMPTRYVAWSHSFADATPRDDLFIWLAERVHRWDEWGELAHRKGAHALTSHLLSLIVGAGGLST